MDNVIPISRAKPADGWKRHHAVLIDKFGMFKPLFIDLLGDDALMPGDIDLVPQDQPHGTFRKFRFDKFNPNNSCYEYREI